MLLDKPEELRIGQNIENFLMWLHYEKGHPAKDGIRADVYHMTDEVFEKYYTEYLSYLT